MRQAVDLWDPLSEVSASPLVSSGSFYHQPFFSCFSFTLCPKVLLTFDFNTSIFLKKISKIYSMICFPQAYFQTYYGLIKGKMISSLYPHCVAHYIKMNKDDLEMTAFHRWAWHWASWDPLAWASTHVKILPSFQNIVKRNFLYYVLQSSLVCPYIPRFTAHAHKCHGTCVLHTLVLAKTQFPSLILGCVYSVSRDRFKGTTQESPCGLLKMYAHDNPLACASSY